MVPGTNIVYDDHFDGNVVWLDLDEPDPSRRYKQVGAHAASFRRRLDSLAGLALRTWASQAAVLGKNKFQCYTISESADGIHWNVTNPCTGATPVPRMPALPPRFFTRFSPSSC